MKLNFTRLFAVLFVVALIYASCKKTENRPAVKSATDYTALSSRIALNLVRSLNGKYGGGNVGDGIKVPSAIKKNNKGPVLYGVTSFCGYTIDTAYINNVIAGDTSKTTEAKFKFVYGCDSTVVNSYTLYDSLKNVEKGTAFLNTYIVAQSYYVKALDQTYKLVSMTGYINTLFDKSTTAMGTAPATDHSVKGIYYLQGLKVSVTNGATDIQSGVALFNMTTLDIDAGNPAPGLTGGYTGSITFLGNHKATLTLKISATETKIFDVDLLTGTATPA